MKESRCVLMIYALIPNDVFHINTETTCRILPFFDRVHVKINLKDLTIKHNNVSVWKAFKEQT